MDYENADLQTKTLKFWELARAARGLQGRVTTGGAISATNALLGCLNPSRPLWSRVAVLQANIVAHGSCRQPRKRKLATPPNVTQLRK